MPIRHLERLAAQARWEEGQSELESLLTVGRLTPAQQAVALQIGCRIYNQLKNYYVAVQMGKAAVELADTIHDTRVVVLAHLDLGLAHLWLGDACGAVNSLTACLAAVEKVDRGAVPVELTGKAWFHLGVARRLLEDWPAAIAAFLQACACYRQNGVRVAEIRCWQDIAWCYLFAGDLDAAALAQATSADLLSHYPDDCLAAHQACIQARATFLRGNDACAGALAFQVLNGEHSPDVMAAACWIAGEASLVAGQRAEAEFLAEQALEHSKACPFPHVVACAYALWRRTRAESDLASLP